MEKAAAAKAIIYKCIPVDKGSKEATFTALAKDFGLDNILFLGEPMVILEDFRYYFADKREIDAFVEAEKPRHHCAAGSQLVESIEGRRRADFWRPLATGYGVDGERGL